MFRDIFTRKFVIGLATASLLIIIATSIVAYMEKGARTETSVPTPFVQEPNPTSESIVAKLPLEYRANPEFLSCVRTKISACSSNATIGTGLTFDAMIEPVLNIAKNDKSTESCLSNVILVCNDMTTRVLAQEDDSPAICDNQIDPLFREDCLNNLYNKLSIKNDSVDECKKIANDDIEILCVNQYYQKKSVTTRDITLCDRIVEESGQTSCKNNFNLAVALDTKNIQICENETDFGKLSACVTTFIEQNMLTNLNSCELNEAYISYAESNEISLDNLIRDCNTRLFDRLLQELSAGAEPDSILLAQAVEICDSVTEIPEKNACTDKLNRIRNR